MKKSKAKRHEERIEYFKKRRDVLMAKTTLTNKEAAKIRIWKYRNKIDVPISDPVEKKVQGEDNQKRWHEHKKKINKVEPNEETT